MDRERIIQNLSAKLFYKPKKRGQLFKESLQLLFFAFVIFQLLPYYKPESGIPEIHFSWTISLFVWARTSAQMVKIGNFLLFPRRCTFSSLLPLSYDDRVAVSRCFIRNLITETLFYTTVTFVIGTVLGAVLLETPLFSGTVLISLGIISSVYAFQFLCYQLSGSASRFVSSDDRGFRQSRNILQLHSLNEKISQFRITLSEKVTVRMKNRRTALAVRHQLHTLLRESKLHLTLVLFVLPLLFSYLLSLFPEVTGRWLLTLIFGGFSAVLFALGTPFIHSKKMLMTMPYYNLSNKDVHRGNLLISIFLFIPLGAVYLIFSAKTSPLLLLLRPALLIPALCAVLIWSQFRISRTYHNDTLQLLQMILIFILFLSADTFVFCQFIT